MGWSQWSRIRGATGEMECWSIGVLDYWVLNASLQYSFTPILQFLVRWIAWSEAGGSFWAVYSFPDLPIPEHNKLGGRQFFQSHGSKRVDLARADANLGTQTQFAAIIESGGGIDHDRR